MGLAQMQDIAFGAFAIARPARDEVIALYLSQDRSLHILPAARWPGALLAGAGCRGAAQARGARASGSGSFSRSATTTWVIFGIGEGNGQACGL